MPSLIAYHLTGVMHSWGHKESELNPYSLMKELIPGLFTSKQFGSNFPLHGFANLKAMITDICHKPKKYICCFYGNENVF